MKIERTADENVTGKSLTFYRKEFSPKLSIRYSLKNLKQEDGLLNIPLFMSDLTYKLLAIYKL